jgi:hypothetical protein
MFHATSCGFSWCFWSSSLPTTICLARGANRIVSVDFINQGSPGVSRGRDSSFGVISLSCGRLAFRPACLILAGKIVITLPPLLTPHLSVWSAVLTSGWRGPTWRYGLTRNLFPVCRPLWLAIRTRRIDGEKPCP